GSVAWAKNLGGSSFDRGNSIATDSSGNLYTTGDFTDTATFGSTTLTSNGSADIFVAKLGSDGSVAWAKNLGGSNLDIGNSIATDSSGNSYTTGYFRDTATFGSTTLTSNGSNDIFVTKLGSDGSVAWAKSFGSSGSDDGSSIATDSSGNVYTSGDFNGTATFGSATLTSKGNADIFVTKLGTLAPNTPPNIALSGDAPSYTENAAPVVIDSSATVTDSDSPNFNNGTLTVQFTAGGTADERLAIRNQGNSAGQIGTDGSIIKFGGVQIGTFAGGIGTEPLVITLNASATPTIAQALLRNITYANASENPSTAGRTVSFVLTDGGGGTSNTVTKNISVTAVDDTEFLVTNTNNSGEGSLRQAILNANADPGTEAIAFNIAGGGVKTISPTSALPTITDAVIIDGTTQPGFSNTPLIELNGSNAGANTIGLKIAAGNSTVRGLVINRFLWDGIELSGGGNNLIEGNFIGTNAAGIAAAGNHSGIFISDGSTNNTIGGTTAASRNVISGNLFGVSIFTDANKVQGNYIGTDVTGTLDVGNSADGVTITGYLVIGPGGERIISASNNLIGGTTPGARNIISGNNHNGVGIDQRGATNNQVIGNYIGTDVTGTLDLGNSSSGVEIQYAPNNTIGGTKAGERNVISGNNVYGIWITGNAATGNKVQGNYIGTNAVGTSAVGNSRGVNIYAANNIVGGNVISGNIQEGIVITGTEATGNQVTGNLIGTKVDGTSALGNRSHGVVVASARNNTIGGTDVGAGNTIAFNGGNGVLVYENFGTATGDRISANSIWANSGIGIDLGDNGVTANDVDDADTGANNLQNFPVFATVSKNGSSLNVTYKVPSSNTNSTYPIRVEFFLSDGNGEGKTFLGADTYNTPNVDKTFSFSPTVTVNFGDKIVATATDNNGNTSEFSIEQLVINPNTAPILDLNGAGAGINYNTTFTRSGGAIAVVDSSNLSLADDGTTINSATVTITNLLNGASELLSAVTTNTNITATYNNGILTLTGSDTVTNYQTVLRSIAYNNTAIIPNTTARNIEFVVNDGSLNSTVATTTLAINMPTTSLGSNITTGTRIRPPVASLNNTTSEVLYSFNLSTATRIVANLMMNGGNADLALIDSNGMVLASSIRGGTLAENIDRAGLLPGQYFIRVYRVDPGATVNYQLSINFA
ncbi:MAG TPA: hypothetical protein DCZ55_23690, partial [Cyanobacteria bacterium UBA11371]|nr:hypothetical protein [Cyanobacteria bacterium UBA11371]